MAAAVNRPLLYIYAKAGCRCRLAEPDEKAGLIMATYQTIQETIKRRHQRSVKTCWIAHVKELNGLAPERAPNRIAPNRRENPCPDWARPLIEDAMRRLGG